MTDLEQICENALYDEIRVLEDGKSVVRDIPTGKLYFKKRLDVYNEHVFNYLRGHKNRNVAAVQAYWKDGEQLVVIEELIQGRTLDELLSADESGAETAAPFTFSERIDILAQICEGLQFLHSADPPIIHRDIKASNIMVTDDGVVKIIDYDAAKIYITGQKKDTVMIGTQGLAAPEQYGFAQSDVRTDLYALGKLIERMLPGNADAQKITAKATEMDPKKRYTSAEQMKGQIRRIRENNSKLDQAFEKIPGFDPMNRSHRIRARIGLAASIAAVIALAIFLRWQLFVIPQRQAEQIRTELAAIAELKASDGGIPDAVSQFAAAHPYKTMNETQKKAVRDGIEDAVTKCCQSMRSEDADAVITILKQNYGEDAVWDAVYSYGKAGYSFSREEFGKAFELLRESKENGEVDAEEHWDGAVQRTRESAGQKMKDFAENINIDALSKALEVHAVLLENGAETKEEFDEVYKEVLAVTDGLKKKRNWIKAEETYRALQNSELVDHDEMEELIKEMKYEQAEVYFASGSCEQAAKVYSELGDYKDSAGKYKESMYLQANKELKRKDYKSAIASLTEISGYKDADALQSDAKYHYCEENWEEPTEEVYAYIEELVDSGYEDAEDLRDKIYEWRIAKVEKGGLYSLGASQCVYFRVTLAGGPPDAAATVRFTAYNYQTGDDLEWTDETERKKGETSEVNLYEDNSSYSIFDQTLKIRVYVNGELKETWEGKIGE